MTTFDAPGPHIWRPRCVEISSGFPVKPLSGEAEMELAGRDSRSCRGPTVAAVWTLGHGSSRVTDRCLLYGAISAAFLMREEIRCDAIAALRLCPAAAVLEIGCGAGTNLELLSSAVGRDGRVCRRSRNSPHIRSPKFLRFEPATAGVIVARLRDGRARELPGPAPAFAEFALALSRHRRCQGRRPFGLKRGELRRRASHLRDERSTSPSENSHVSRPPPPFCRSVSVGPTPRRAGAAAGRLPGRGSRLRRSPGRAR